MSKKYLLLDRDGTLIKHVPYLCRIDQVEILPGVIPTLVSAAEMKFRFGIITNQSAIGRGLASREDVNLVNEFIAHELLRLCGVRFDFIYYCPHIPEDKCACRKPETGLIASDLSMGRISISESFMIGDQETDVLFGKNIGVRTILITKRRDLETVADFVLDDFLAVGPLLRL
jgi:histidinol-phosphate phosphatase family protein